MELTESLPPSLPPSLPTSAGEGAAGQHVLRRAPHLTGRTRPIGAFVGAKLRQTEKSTTAATARGVARDRSKRGAESRSKGGRGRQGLSKCYAVRLSHHGLQCVAVAICPALRLRVSTDGQNDSSTVSHVRLRQG
eukprot:2026108-Rhodomonas_salina.1